MGHDGGVADQLPPCTFVVVSGPPASGKTTLARAIAPALGLPLIAKDTIKEALMSVLPVPDIETSRAAGHFAAERTAAELWNDEVARPVAGGWPVLEICTNDPVDVAPLFARIRAAAGMAA
jgi:ATPase family associated with various cellular activities (AAA)